MFGISRIFNGPSSENLEGEQEHGRERGGAQPRKQDSGGPSVRWSQRTKVAAQTFVFQPCSRLPLVVILALARSPEFASPHVRALFCRTAEFLSRNVRGVLDRTGSGVLHAYLSKGSVQCSFFFSRFSEFQIVQLSEMFGF